MFTHSAQSIFAASLALVCITSDHASAAGVIAELPAVALTRDGNDLVITLDNPVIFTTNRAVSSTSFSFLMPDAINVAGTGGFSVNFDAANVPRLSADGGLTSFTPTVALLRGGRTLEINYMTATTVVIPSGGEMVLSAGVVRSPNFFNFAIIQGIANAEIPMITLADANHSPQAISAPTAAIPEPGAAILLAAGAIGLARRRNRK